MKAIITGGAGFIGVQLSAYLQAFGMEIIVVDKHIPASSRTNGIRYQIADIRDPALGSLFEKEKPDIVCHLAAQKAVTYSMQAPTEDAAHNIMGTVQLLDLATKHGVRHFLFTSTAAVYGIPRYLPMDETHPIHPISFYGLSKLMAENYIKMYAQHAGFNYTIFRLANIYGPPTSPVEPSGIIQILLDHIAKHKPFTIFGDGTQTRDFLHIADVLTAFRLAIQHPINRTINLSNNCATSINDLINATSMLSKEMPAILYTDKRDGDIQHSRLDNILACEKLDWQPTLSIMEGLKQILASTAHKL